MPMHGLLHLLKSPFLMTSKKISLRRIILLCFLLLCAAFFFFIKKLASADRDNWVHAAATRSQVVEIYQAYKGKPNYLVMKLSDSQRFTIPKIVLGKVHTGDSVIKEKDSSFYVFIMAATGEKVKAGWQ